MISCLRGKLIELDKTFIILDVQGVGYRVYMPIKALNSLAKNNEGVKELKIYTQMFFNQREGISTLYGFLKKDDLELFGLLTSISGIGPKNAMNILSSIETGELIAAVSKEDADYLRKVSGLGPKTAKRLVVELKDKLDNIVFAGFAKIDLSHEIDAIDALISLGYQKYQAQEALRKVSQKTKGLEDKVKEALKILSKKEYS
ncbi:MAG: Holliday junction branch migration protein RuvA [Parcubacteria group bacterium]|nr:Holliday junction branch migration protein RuvA [Parcubacteria group bacterium]